MDTPSFTMCLLSIVCPFCSVCQLRNKVNAKYNIDEGCLGEVLRALLCAPCSLAQTHRELSLRGFGPGGFCVKEPLTSIQ